LPELLRSYADRNIWGEAWEALYVVALLIRFHARFFDPLLLLPGFEALRYTCLFNACLVPDNQFENMHDLVKAMSVPASFPHAAQ
jgi:hypothetical protein